VGDVVLFKENSEPQLKTTGVILKVLSYHSTEGGIWDGRIGSAVKSGF